jgi:hypothetical protein
MDDQQKTEAERLADAEIDVIISILEALDGGESADDEAQIAAWIDSQAGARAGDDAM